MKNTVYSTFQHTLKFFKYKSSKLCCIKSVDVFILHHPFIVLQHCISYACVLMLPPPANQFVRDKQIQCKDVRMSIQTFDVTLDTLWGQGQIDELDIPVVDSIHVTILSITQVRECRYLQVATVHFLRLFFFCILTCTPVVMVWKSVWRELSPRTTMWLSSMYTYHTACELWLLNALWWGPVVQKVSIRLYHSDDARVATPMSHAWLQRCHMRGYHDVTCVATTMSCAWLQRLNSFTKLTTFVDFSCHNKSMYHLRIIVL